MYSALPLDVWRERVETRLQGAPVYILVYIHVYMSG